VRVSLTKTYLKIEIYSSLPLDVPKDVAKVFHEYYLFEFFGEIRHFICVVGLLLKEHA